MHLPPPTMAPMSGTSSANRDRADSKPLPAVLLIPGAFSTIPIYDPIVTGLRAHGYEVFAFDVPTASRKPGERPNTLYEDVSFFSGILTTLCDLGKDVVVVGHSYAGLILTACGRGLTTKRERNGCRTGVPGEGRVIGLVYLAAYVPRVGQSMININEEMELQFDSVDADGPFLYHSDLVTSARTTFSDLPEADAMAIAEQFRFQSYLSITNETEHAGYVDVDKVVFIIPAEDIPLPPRVQKRMAETVRKARPGGDVSVYEVKAGHGAPFTRPDLVIPLVVDVLRKEF
ncbi:uncharacterized protein MYCFIDRAFT_56415 [Pseudocercospora fijiensis CIRAD86]|uniref:AB hydrolase-1 domain-containing protein n=1 Tax=Pseudocercospora fijiensis (strain CIRAD86) TaxID=383855 RepID=M3AC34_PSEFD|nr:uncharacterized protein MYCFIDRAFT_56415 [Pseudocercospora fijiensis CIRAD86]EME82126.1 hypothetical protein MYCFIDRAFT_56415 [Pseudocercospora fijiensis CIRAD86]